MAISHRFSITQLRFESGPRYNISPGQTVAVVVAEEGRSLESCSWGLIPFWSQDPRQRWINARAETLSLKPAFKRALVRQRCLIPADGFYEWTGSARARRPIHFRLRNGPVFAFAGLWDEWHHEANPPLRTCTVITVEPNSLVAPIHNRMPAILLPDDEAVWLDPTRSVADALNTLRPYPAEAMESFPVSPRVNSAAVDDPACLLPEPRDLL